MKLPFSLQIFKEYSNIKFHENPSSGCRLVEMVGAWHGHCMVSVNQTRPHCVNQMGKTHSKPLAARCGKGKGWARHGHDMLCVNRS